MKLELLTEKPNSGAHHTPILFVHGLWCAAWCWADFFLPYFAAHGYIVHALSLRGHGASEGRERLRWTSIADYVTDLTQVVAELERMPVLVGHSMGGLVLQHYLQRHDAPAAVLLASAPHRGLSWRLGLNLIQRFPSSVSRVLTTRSLYPLVSTPELAQQLFLSPDIGQDRLLAFQQRLQDESLRALLDMVFGRRPKPGLVDTPVLVLAAGNDRLISPSEGYGLAHAYRADIAVVPDVAHAMMLDTGWQQVADVIMRWLREQGVP